MTEAGIPAACPDLEHNDSRGLIEAASRHSALSNQLTSAATTLFKRLTANHFWRHLMLWSRLKGDEWIGILAVLARARGCYVRH
jgi:hypothetical protein